MLNLSGTFYTLKELAEKWGCAVVSVNYHIQKGSLRATKIGQTYIVQKEDAELFTQNMLQSTRAKFVKRVLGIDPL